MARTQPLAFPIRLPDAPLGRGVAAAGCQPYSDERAPGRPLASAGSLCCRAHGSCLAAGGAVRGAARVSTAVDKSAVRWSKRDGSCEPRQRASRFSLPSCRCASRRTHPSRRRGGRDDGTGRRSEPAGRYMDVGRSAILDFWVPKGAVGIRSKRLISDGIVVDMAGVRT